MYETHSAGAIVLSLLLILSTGLAGVAVATDGPESITPLQSSGGEITVVDDADNSTDGAEDQQPGDSFVVTNFEAPERVAVGEAVSVTATISNPNTFETNQSVEFRLDGDVVARQPFELDGEAEQTVTFELDTDELGVGTYIHGFLTTDRGGLAVLEVIPFAELAIEEQESDGDNVVVDSATLSEGGFVAIYDEDGSFLGVSAYLDAGEHEGVEIELFEDDRIEFDRDELDEENTLTAVAHLNTTDNETFDFVVNESLDRPYVDVGGEPITDNATVTVPAEAEESTEEEEIEEAEAEEVEEAEDAEAEEEDEAEAEESEETDEADAEEPAEADEQRETDPETDTDEITPIVDFSDQESDGESVIVDNATLPVDGYVAISEDEEIIGVSEYLEAGEHTDIPIELFDVRSASFDREKLTELTTLTATLHEENSGNEKFDHVRNDIRDGPIVDDEGTPVSEMAEITVPESVAEDPVEADENGDDADESAVDEAEDADESAADANESDTEVNETDDEGESNGESDESADDETDSSDETSEEDDSTEPATDESDEAGDSDNEADDDNSEESEQEADESESGDNDAEETNEASDESNDEENDSSANSDNSNGVDDATESADDDDAGDGNGDAENGDSDATDSEESEQEANESEDGDEDVAESDDESDGESSAESSDESDESADDGADESDDADDVDEESDADEDSDDGSEDEDEEESDDEDDTDDEDSEDDEESDDSE